VKFLVGEIKEKYKAEQEMIEQKRQHQLAKRVLDKPLRKEKFEFGGNDSPHIQCKFNDPLVHRDAWGIICAAVEKQVSVEDAERVAAFWSYFVHPMFELPQSWLVPGKSARESLLVRNARAELTKYLAGVIGPGTARTRGGSANAEQLDKTNDKGTPGSIEESFPAGTRVMTPFGLGVISTQYDMKKEVYEVQLDWGTAFVHPDEVQLETSFDSSTTSIAKPSALLSEKESKEGKEAPDDKGKDDEDGIVYYGPASAYVFFRLYHVLYERLQRAKLFCQRPEIRNRTVMKHPADRPEENKTKGQMSGEEYKGEPLAPTDAEYHEYDMTIALIHALVSGNIENSKFEEECRNLMGSGSYFLFTIERLIQAAVKQILVLVSDDKVVENLRAVNEYEKSREASAMAKVYQLNSSLLFQQDGVCYKFQFSSGVRKKRKVDVESKDNTDDKKSAEEKRFPIPDKFKKVEPTADIWEVKPKLLIKMVHRLPSTDSIDFDDEATLNTMEVDEGDGKDGESTKAKGELTKLVTVKPIEIEYEEQLREALSNENEEEKGKDDESGAAKPFLDRAAKENKEKAEERLAKTEKTQGLRMQLTLPLFKIVYVPGSEDVFRIIKADKARKEQEKAAESASTENAPTRKQRFEAWWSSQVFNELKNDSKVEEASSPEREIIPKVEEKNEDDGEVKEESKESEKPDIPAESEDKMDVDENASKVPSPTEPTGQVKEEKTEAPSEGKVEEETKEETKMEIDTQT